MTDDALYSAASSGGATEVHVSSDGGRSWRLRYSDGKASPEAPA